ncbi:DUF6801 domain-containing protein [Saccharothrix longispora]|uniref:Fibronectin type-III domain-containing protein n=1 Tax=Saccharothrix longispora TaxID=33920 RepID=A0ABU1PTN9_9PSEU|nr:fibronectin type III domain-containing protein [Saccharothrix longispora]MDR6593966.1 hypothetical protein [Saccharothrix longispora]
MRAKWKPYRVATLSLASALVAAGALAGAAGPASAGTTAVRLDYTCTTSLGPTVEVTAWAVGGLPDDGSGPNSVPRHQPAFIDVDVYLMELRPVLELADEVRLDGDSTATLGARITGPDGTRTVEAALTVAPAWVRKSQGASLRTGGAFPVQYLSQEGYYDLHVDGLELVLRPKRADGTSLGTVTASCSHDPAQNDLLGTVWSQGLVSDRPLRPTGLHVVSTTPTSVTLAWEANSWWFPTAGYDVYIDGGNFGRFPGKQATLTGLTPDRLQRAKVVTVDVTGSQSTKSQGLLFTTPPA